MIIFRSAAIAALALVVLTLFVAPNVRAATYSETVLIDVGVGTTPGQPDGYDAGVFGSASPTTTVDGYPYQLILERPGVCTPRGCGTGSDEVQIGGFTADPGQSWLASFTMDRVTRTGASATYSYSGGLASWTWSDCCTFGSAGTQTSVMIVHTLAAGTSGTILPKYQVVGLTYAPPGAKSSATYANGFMSGSSTGNTSSFKTGVTVTDSVSGGFNLFGILNGSATSTYTAGWEQTTSTNNTITLSQQYATGLVVPGPLSSTVGVDHDYDTVYVWLNPAVDLTIYPSGAVSFTGYNWDARDTITGMDVIPLTVGQLRGTQAITDPAVKTRLDRTWDPNLGALTSVDFLAIARTDPFYGTPAFNPNTDTSHRYELPNGNDLIFNYVPVAAGGQATGQTYTSSYSTTSVAGQSASTSYTVGYSIEGQASAQFILGVNNKIKVASTYAYTTGWSSSITSGTSQNANFTIYPPLSTDNYVGPTAIQVWKDNVFGTFMFYPEN